MRNRYYRDMIDESVQDELERRSRERVCDKGRLLLRAEEGYEVRFHALEDVAASTRDVRRRANRGEREGRTRWNCTRS